MRLMIEEIRQGAWNLVTNTGIRYNDVLLHSIFAFVVPGKRRRAQKVLHWTLCPKDHAYILDMANSERNDSSKSREMEKKKKL